MPRPVRSSLGIEGRVVRSMTVPGEVEERLRARLETERQGLLDRVTARNTRFFDEELEKLERWADDLKGGLEREIKDLDTDIRDARREARLERGLEAKVAAQRRIKDLEAERTRKRRALFEAQDEIDRKKEALIGQVEGRLRQTVTEETLFTIRWSVL